MKNNQEIKIFAPATVANISCGFDVLGLCLATIGDEMFIKKSQQKGIKITKITGQKLPFEATKNVAGVAALALLDKIDLDFGFEIEIIKNIKPGSGIGSSAASAAGAVFAINELLEKPFTPLELTQFAMQGEKLAGGTVHADNVAPALFGGFTLVRESNPLDVLSLPTPRDLFVVILHPQIKIKTSESRALLPKEISLVLATKQWANLGALVSALYTNNYTLLSKALKDHVVTPYRSQLIPYYTEIESLVLANNALGFGISGSGPSMFSLVKGEEQAYQIKKLISQKYKETNIPFHCFVSKINQKGIKII
jgi:homoserine kinase